MPYLVFYISMMKSRFSKLNEAHLGRMYHISVVYQVRMTLRLQVISIMSYGTVDPEFTSCGTVEVGILAKQLGFDAVQMLAEWQNKYIFSTWSLKHTEQVLRKLVTPSLIYGVLTFTPSELYTHISRVHHKNTQYEVFSSLMYVCHLRKVLPESIITPKKLF